MKTVYWVLVIIFTAALAVTSFVTPELLSGNEFLNAFMGDSLLNVLGVILAITASSAAHLHLKFNDLEEKHKQLYVFDGARREIRSDTFFLMWSFCFAVVVLIVRSADFASDAMVKSICNSLGLIVLLLNILILVDITDAIFSITPVLESEDNESERKKRQDFT